MVVMLMVRLKVPTARESEMATVFGERHRQSMRLGALSHTLWAISEVGQDGANFMGTMTFRSMDHMGEFGAAQEADAESRATMERVIGPGGLATIVGQSVAVEVDE